MARKKGKDRPDAEHDPKPTPLERGTGGDPQEPPSDADAEPDGAAEPGDEPGDERSPTATVEELSRESLLTKPMRTLDRHRINRPNELLAVEVLDVPGPGGASSHYRVRGFNAGKNKVLEKGPLALCGVTAVDLVFQSGEPDEVGANGVTMEALLAIVQDRLEGFQAGPHACEENRMAIAYLRGVMHYLRMRSVRVDGAVEEGAAAAP